MSISTIKELQMSLADVKKEITTLPLENLCIPKETFDEKLIDVKNININSLIPIIVYQSDDRYIIIDGCKRYLSMQKTLKDSLCVILKFDKIEKMIDINKYAFLLRIFLNTSRKVELVEKVLFLKWLRENSEDNLYKEFCSLLEIDHRERYELEKLGGCDFSIMLAVKNKILDPSVAFEVNKMREGDRDAIISFFGNYLFSKQMQRELVDILSELAFRDKCTIKDILVADEHLKKIEKNSTLNNPQKIEKIRNYLFERRFPLVAQTKKVWKEKTSAINPDPSRVHFKPSESFEKDFLEIRVNVSSAKQAKDIFVKLSEISEEEWGEIIYPC